VIIVRAVIPVVAIVAPGITVIAPIVVAVPLLRVLTIVAPVAVIHDDRASREAEQTRQEETARDAIQEFHG
jgi:hypothetical protein